MKDCYLVAEIGINHNGDLNIAKKLIDEAKIAGFNAVKFQKRDINVVYTEKFLESDQKVARILNPLRPLRLLSFDKTKCP